MNQANGGWFKPFIAIVLTLFFLVIILPVITLFYLLIASPVRIVGQTMAPEFTEGQNWVVNHITYRLSQPQRGDVIVFVSPKQQGIQLIKRIVGLPSEEISLQKGKLYINNQIVSEPYVSGVQTSGGTFLMEGKSVKIPENSYFVLGDNRDRSSDSREWGFIRRESIIGKLWFRYH